MELGGEVPEVRVEIGKAGALTPETRGRVGPGDAAALPGGPRAPSEARGHTLSIGFKKPSFPGEHF